MLGDVEGSAHPARVLRATHQDDGIRVREDVPLADRLGNHVVEQDMGGGVEVEATDGGMVVGMGLDVLLLGAESLAEDLTRGPGVLFAEDVMVEVLEELELDRLG